jgi:hypothetical protein
MTKSYETVATWKCKNGHVLGAVRRNSSGIRQLWLYRQAIDLETMDESPDVIGVVDGHVMDIKCSVCGEIRTWVPGQEHLEALVEQVLKGRRGR